MAAFACYFFFLAGAGAFLAVGFFAPFLAALGLAEDDLPLLKMPSQPDENFLVEPVCSTVTERIPLTGMEARSQRRKRNYSS